ncbi:MAG TPA: hypothetical protein VIM11_16270 [Tepidisphaeraceae bacterium]
MALGIFTNFAIGALPSFAVSYGTAQPAGQVFSQTLIGGAAGVAGGAAGRIVAAPLFRAGQAIGFGATAASALAGAGAGGVAGAIYGGATGYATSGTLRGAIEGAEQLGALGFLGGGLAGAGNSLFGAVRNSYIGTTIATERAAALENANYAQKSFSKAFSTDPEALFPGKTIDDVAGAIRSGQLAPKDVPVQYIVREGNSLILNTRSAQALEQAGIPRSQWNAVNMTGDAGAEARLTGQLQRNGLTSQGTSTVAPTRGN